MISFKLYDPDGLLVGFDLPLIDNDPAASASRYKAELLAQGYRLTLPDKQAREERTDRAVGYIWGTTKDPRNGGRQLVCWIWNERGKYYNYAVYPEHHHLLPADVLKHKPKDLDGAYDGAPPDIETAQTSRKWHPWNATFRITPRLDKDGNVVKDKKTGRYVEYDFAGMTGSNPTPQPEPVAEHRQPAPATATERVERLRQAGRQQTQAISSTQEFKTWHALGNTYWGEEWDQKRERGVIYCGRQRKPPVELDSSSQLTMEEIAAWTEQLEGLTREAILEAAEKKLDDESYLLEMLKEEGITVKTSDASAELDKVYGVPLTHVLKRLDKLDPLPEDAQA